MNNIEYINKLYEDEVEDNYQSSLILLKIAFMNMYAKNEEERMKILTRKLCKIFCITTSIIFTIFVILNI